MNLNKLTEYTANQTQKETKQYLYDKQVENQRLLAEQESRRLMQPKPLPTPEPKKPTEWKPLPIEKKPKKPRKWLKRFGLIFLGFVIGILLTATGVAVYTVDKCEPLVTAASKEYYAMGASFVIQSITETGEVPYFDEGEIKTTPIEQLKAGGVQ